MRSKSSDGDNQKACEEEFDEDDENNESQIHEQQKVDKNGPHPLRMKR